jgi:predicted nucleic-acid-binding Zn-ribbon protein
MNPKSNSILYHTGETLKEKKLVSPDNEGCFMRDGRCPKCGSAEVIPNVYIQDRGEGQTENLKVIVEENPHAWVFKGAVKTSLKAWICGVCGFTELYAKDPADLLTAYRKQEEQS